MPFGLKNNLYRFIATIILLSLFAAACSPGSEDGKPRVLNVELIQPTVPINQGHIFDLQLKLSNPGIYNVHVTRVTLPAEVMNSARYLGSTPPLTLNQNQAGEGLIEMDLTIAPTGLETFVFRFEASQTGSLRGQGKVSTDEQDYPFQVDTAVAGVNPEGWQPGLSPEVTPGALGPIPWQAVVQIEAIVDVDGRRQTGWTGSGTIISPDGLVLTNAHVVLSDRFYNVVDLVVSLTVAQDSPPVASYYASIVQADAALDIALIKPYQDINGHPLNYNLLDLPFVPLGDSDQLDLGESLAILGYPGIGGETITLTRGEVSGFTAEAAYGNRAYIKTSATIAGGNSGGLAVNEQGELVGVPTAVGSGDLGVDVVDCRALIDTNRDGYVDDQDSCVPTGGFINALRPINLALGLIEAARKGEVSIRTGITSGESFEPAGQVIYEDDFSTPTSGWKHIETEKGTAGYENGEYAITVTDSMFYLISDREFAYDPIGIEADARVVQPAGDADFGFVCGYDGGDYFYVLEISEDGYYSIWKQAGEELTFLVEWTYSQEIAAGGVMRLGAHCGSDQLILALNGKVLASAFDPEFRSGNIGIMAGTFDLPGIKVAFDNLKIILP
jgi:S1-C subfamily serine protease